MDSTQNKILPKGDILLNGTYQCSRFNDGIVFAAARLLLFLHWYEIIKSLPRLLRILYISEICFINFISVVEVSINGRIKRLLHGLQARVCEKESPIVTDSFNQNNMIWTALKTRYYRKALYSSMELTNVPDSTMVSSLLLACFSSSIGTRLLRVCLGFFEFFTFPKFASSISPFPSSRLVAMVESNGCSVDCKQEFVRRIQ